MHNNSEQGMVSARRVLATIQSIQRTTGHTPSVRELQAATGLTHATVWAALLRLRAEYGYVRWDRGQARTFRVTERYD